ncbi:MAG: molecular chaperone DnaK [Methanocella sp. PtaU1.Bin125]|nr:MAG: molecular chaperone DnaK [Methanocella sp. PtaU1.Bin125]
MGIKITLVIIVLAVASLVSGCCCCTNYVPSGPAPTWDFDDDDNIGGSSLVGAWGDIGATGNIVDAAGNFVGDAYGAEAYRFNADGTYQYRIVEGPHADVRIQLREKIYSVPEISAMILQEMKIIAEDYLGEEVSKAVITCPAYFNDNQRQATKDAGLIAGLDVIRVINEPTAAALAYGFGKKIDRLVAVYDLGGGTFDISLLEIGSEGVFKVVSTAGDTFLGGEDFDARIMDWLLADFQAKHGVDLRQDRMAMQRLKDAAEKAKCELSATRQTEINLPFIISTGRNEALHLQCQLTREKLEELTGDLIQQTIDICANTLDEAGLDIEDIEDVVLVGGMTRMPKVQERVAELFKREPCKGVHPDEVVALGAAIQGSMLVAEKSEVMLLDVTPHTLGIMVVGGFFEPLIPKDTTVPTSQTKTFTTVRDNQTAVKILVLQGESEKAEENELLGEFVLTGLRRAPKGEVEIDVTFEINADGIVAVSARDLETGQEQSITVTASSGLTKEEVKEMAQSSHEYLVERRRGEEAEKANQEAETLIGEIERYMPQVEEVVRGSEHGPEAISKAKEVVEHARNALRSGVPDAEMKEILDSLRRTLRMFKAVLT